MKWLQRVPGAVFVASGLACGWQASTFDVAFMMDPVGPKALPGLVAVVLTATGIHALARPTGDFTWLTRGAMTRVGSAAGAFLLYGAALPFLGFFLSTSLVVSALSRLFGASNRQAIPSALLLSGALWLIFVLGLGLPLPVGELWIL